MAEEQKNSSAETVDAAASAAHTVKGARGDIKRV